MTDQDMRNCNPDAGLIMYAALNNCRDIMEYFPAGKNKLIILYLLQSKTVAECILRQAIAIKKKKGSIAVSKQSCPVPRGPA